MARGIRRQLARARARLRAELHASTNSAGPLGSRARSIAGGLASEGWVGGYLAALSDIELLLNGVQPSTRGLYDSHHHYDKT